MSIRARLTLGIAVLLLGIFVLLGAAIVGTTRATLIDQVDTQLQQSSLRSPGPGPGPDVGPRNRFPVLPTRRDAPGDRSASGSASPIAADDRPGGDRDGDHGGDDRGGDSDVPHDPYIRPVARIVFGPRGVVISSEPSGYRDAPDPLPRLPARLLTSNFGDGQIVTLPGGDEAPDYRALIERSPIGVVVVTAAPLTAVEEAVHRVVRVVTFAAGLALLIAALASWWLIGLGLRPVDRMIDTAAGIAAGDLTRRVPDADPQTELGQLGTALNEMLGQIERAAAARAASEERLRRFVADAAHELRTPLTSLRGYAELYRQGALPTPEAVSGAMGRIEAEAVRMGRLVEDLLLLARLDRERAPEREPVDLVAVVREAAADFAAVDPDRPFERQLAPEAIVRGDRIRLRQIVDNLLANVRTHTPAGTPVRVIVRRVGAEAELVVADDGPGIPRAAQERVFERFWRADPGRTRQTGGTGLGLAIIASLVADHGGTIALASESGRGATFTVRLPLANPA